MLKLCLPLLPVFLSTKSLRSWSAGTVATFLSPSKISTVSVVSGRLGSQTQPQICSPFTSSRAPSSSTSPVAGAPPPVLLRSHAPHLLNSHKTTPPHLPPRP